MHLGLNVWCVDTVGNTHIYIQTHFCLHICESTASAYTVRTTFFGLKFEGNPISQNIDGTTFKFIREACGSSLQFITSLLTLVLVGSSIANTISLNQATIVTINRLNIATETTITLKCTSILRSYFTKPPNPYHIHIIQGHPKQSCCYFGIN